MRDGTIHVAKTKALINCAVIAQLICASMISHMQIVGFAGAAAQMKCIFPGENLLLFLAHLHEVHRAIVVTSVVPFYVYEYVYVYVYVRVTLSVKVFYKSISLDHVDGLS